MFGSILISISTLMHIYVFWRIASVSLIIRHVSLKLVIAAGVFLWASFFVGRVYGNHAFHRRNNKSIELMEGVGFQLLRNRWAKIRPGFILASVDDLTSYRRYGFGGDPVSQALANRPPGATVLLSHTPWEAEKATGFGAGLMLSGHTHGGQIWPFGYLARRRYPLLGGRYEIGMTVIVCRGTGTWGPRMRLCRPAEILRVTLRSKKEDVYK